YTPPARHHYTLSLHAALPILGGEDTVENIQLRCRAHNAYEGELFYGHGRPTRPSERRTLPGKSSALGGTRGTPMSVEQLALVRVDRKSTRLNSVTWPSRMPPS